MACKPVGENPEEDKETDRSLVRNLALYIYIFNLKIKIKPICYFILPASFFTKKIYHQREYH